VLLTAGGVLSAILSLHRRRRNTSRIFLIDNLRPGTRPFAPRQKIHTLPSVEDCQPQRSDIAINSVIMISPGLGDHDQTESAITIDWIAHHGKPLLGNRGVGCRFHGPRPHQASCACTDATFNVAGGKAADLRSQVRQASPPMVA
jgi:hypothetical protein